MSAPESLSVMEIRKFMIDNGCKVTNHALVKHFKRFLTHPQTQIEARKEFKTYVNILATVKNENNQKYLILRKKYLNECPTEEAVQRAVAAAALSPVPGSPGGLSIISDGGTASPLRQPPPYIPPPEVGTTPTSSKSQNMIPAKASGIAIEQEHAENYRECVNEFETAVLKIDAARKVKGDKVEPELPINAHSENVVETRAKSVSRQASTEDPQGNKENIPRFSFSSSASGTSVDSANVDKVSSSDADAADNPISVKEATRKFNRMASEEEAKVLSPSNKKKPDKDYIEEKNEPEVTMAHPKAKEWIVAMAKANYQDLAKLAKEYPELVKFADPFKGYTALHWAAKHGNEDVVKLIAGTYKADVNARTNGGYTPLHLAMQFGRVNIFELLCNTYKANRDLMDWSGNKPLDYSRQRTTVSDSTYSKIKAKKKHSEKDLGFLRIGSLNVRVKKTTEAFSNFLGVGSGSGSTMAQMVAANDGAISGASRHHQRSHRHRHQLHQPHNGMTRLRMGYTQPMKTMTMTTPLAMSNQQLSSRASVPISNSKFDKIHKSWGSADNIPHNGKNGNMYTKDLMPPPKSVAAVKKRQKSSKHSSVASSATTDSPRGSISSSNSSSNLYSGYCSMPTTPNQLRAPIGIASASSNNMGDSDSDSACGFDSNWSSVNSRGSLSSGNLQASRFS